VGDIDLPYESLPLAVGSSTNLVAYTPEPDSADYDTVALLASWAMDVEHPDDADIRQGSSQTDSPSP
jgi:hypothetical protein